MKKLLTTLCFLAGIVFCQAQIPAEVESVLKKCSDKMHNPEGVEMDMRLNVKAVVSFNGTIKIYAKGENSLSKMRMKILGRDVKTETGSNGKQDWIFKQALTEEDKDTLILTNFTSKKGKKGDYDLDFDLHNEYRKAKMKEKDGRYEITFSDPKDKEMPAKTIMVVNKSDYAFYQMSVKDGIVGFTMTATNIKYGVSDATFSLDQKRYANAVVVKRDIGYK